jgi:hypothetical protein
MPRSGRSRERRSEGMHRRRSKWPATWATFGRSCIDQSPCSRRPPHTVELRALPRSSDAPPRRPLISHQRNQTRVLWIDDNDLVFLISSRRCHGWFRRPKPSPSSPTTHASSGHGLPGPPVAFTLFLVLSRWPSRSATMGEVTGVAPGDLFGQGTADDLIPSETLDWAKRVGAGREPPGYSPTRWQGLEGSEGAAGMGRRGTPPATS